MRFFLAKICFGFLCSAPALCAQSYLVLFQQNEVAITSLGHEGYQNLLQSSNGKDLKELEKWLGTHRISSALDDLWLVRGARLDLEKTDAEKLSKQAFVSQVLLDQTRRFIQPSAVETNDPPEEMPWGLKQIGMEKLRAEMPDIDGTGVRVGILDTGIQSRHAEFRRVSSQGTKYSSVQFKDFVSHLKYPYDDHGHGTHVAGTIAGIHTGIAPGCALIAAKAFAANGASSDSILLKSMQWIFDPDGDPATADFPHIVSNSWGLQLPDGVHSVEAFSPYRLAIQTWINGGLIPVFAAGNSGVSPNGMPGGLPEALAVGAIDPEGKVAVFSSRGPNLWNMGTWVLSVFKPDISAPGVDVVSSLSGNKYAAWSGTSMATPHVAGALALMLHANHKLKFTDAKKLLISSSDKKQNIEFGHGVLNAYELVKAAKAY